MEKPKAVSKTVDSRGAIDFDVTMIDYDEANDTYTLDITLSEGDARIFTTRAQPLANGEGLFFPDPLEMDWTVPIRNAIWAELNTAREHNPDGFETLRDLFDVCTPSGTYYF